jgi:hypothetical protein
MTKKFFFVEIFFSGLTDRKFNRMSPSMAGIVGDMTPLKSTV